MPDGERHSYFDLLFSLIEIKNNDNDSFCICRERALGVGLLCLFLKNCLSPTNYPPNSFSKSFSYTRKIIFFLVVTALPAEPSFFDSRHEVLKCTSISVINSNCFWNYEYTYMQCLNLGPRSFSSVSKLVSFTKQREQFRESIIGFTPIPSTFDLFVPVRVTEYQD